MLIYAHLADTHFQAEVAPAVKVVALDLRGDDLPPDLKAEVLASLEKRGLKAAPADAPDLPVLRVFSSLRETDDHLFQVHVDYLYGKREDLEPKRDAEGRPAGPWPSAGLRTMVRDRQRALESLKEGIVSASIRATAVAPPAPVKATVRVDQAGLAPNGVAGGVVGGTGRILEFDFQEVKVKFQPPAPPYPPMAKFAHIQGTVVVEVTIDPEGLPTEARLVSGPTLLADHATTYAMHWQFEPLTLDGKAIYSRFRIVFNFRLQ